MADNNLLIYSMVFIIAIGLIFTLIVVPFTEDGGLVAERNTNAGIEALENVVTYGMPLNWTIDLPLVPAFNVMGLNPYNLIVPNDIKDYLVSVVRVFYYIPNWILIPIAILLTISILYATITLITMFIK